MRSAFRIIALTVAGLFLATATAELGLRLIEATPLWRVLPTSEIALYGPDASTGYRHRPDVSGIWLKEARAFIRTSSTGLRDKERSADRGQNFRTVIVGDSIIEALQVAQTETSVAVAEQTLATQRSGAEAINLGLAGASPPVLVARLKSVGLPLKPDVAIVVTTLGDFLSPGLRDDSAFTGYREGADGQIALSYGFRQGRGFNFRNSTGGQIVYWLLDHSAVVRVLNSRKNIGLFAEWPAAPAPQPAAPADACNIGNLAAMTALWADGKPEAEAKVLNAFLRDLGAISRENRLPIVLAVRGVSLACPQNDALRDALMKAVQTKARAAGIEAADLDVRLADKAGRNALDRLYGFDGKFGRGHLNIEGNRQLGSVLSDIILAAPKPN